VKLTATERRGLRTLAKTGSVADVNGKTMHALARKGLITGKGPGGGWKVTANGRAEITVPNIFDDLFDKKEPAMPKKPDLCAAHIHEHASARDAAFRRLRTVTNVEIDAHPLLTRDQKKLCKIFRDEAAKAGDEFTMLAFAEVTLRASGNDYAAVTNEGGLQAAVNDAAHRRAALLYAYEALKRGPAIVTETIEKRGTLRDIELLVSHGL